MPEDDKIREIQRGGRNKEDVGFHEAGVTNHVEEIRVRCKTETNIEMRREGGMAKIDGVDEGGEVEGAGGREESDEWEEFGNRKVVRKHDPRQPSQQEKEEHEMTHLPFRSWCRHCIMGRGREEDCRKSMEEERQVPEVHLDYMFMGDEKEGKTLAFLVARERETRAVLSTVVPRKTTGEWICRRLNSPQGDWDKIAEQMMLKFGESGHPVFRATSPLSRGVLDSKGGEKLSIHFCADGDTIETVFRTIFL